MPVLSKYPPVQLNDRSSTGEFLFKFFDKFSDRTAIVDGITSESWTFGEVKKLGVATAKGLWKEGLQKGDVGLVCLPNCPEYALIFLGLALRGAVTSGVNPISTSYEIEKQLKNSRCRFVFTDHENLEKVLNAAQKHTKQIQKIFVVGSGNEINGQRGQLITAFLSLLDHAHTVGPDPPSVHINTKKDTLILPYSSGTTGMPKGVMLTHYNINSLLIMVENVWWAKGEKYLSVLPTFHIFGFMVQLHCFTHGITVVTVPKFQPEGFLALTQQHKPEMMFLVPSVLVFLAKHPMVSKYDFSSVSVVEVGGAPSGRDICDEFMRRHPNVLHLVQGYGMTECCGPCCVLPPLALHEQEKRQGSSGRILPSCKAKIVDPETGEELEPHKRGEVCVKSPANMVGYLANPAATAQTIDKQGWLHTGDVGYFDEDEFLYVVDRLKELIKVKAYQVAPAELEDLLLSHPRVQDAAVIGVPHPQDGEVPKAYVVRKDGTLSDEEVKSFVTKKVAAYKQLKGGVEFVERIPKSPSGKILRRLLRTQMAPAKI